MSALLEMRGIVRCFGAVRANDGIDLEVRSGEILGLLGENGSGKSTLMKVLFGMTAPDSGEIIFRGRALSGHRPAEAMAAGIAMIHQHFMLIEAMSVVENVMLGWPSAGRVLKRAEIAARVSEASQRFGLDLKPDAMIASLPLGRRQRVEILKAALRDAELLILDEPTSNLAPTEVADLLSILRRLRAEGKGIVFISHKLPEVLDVCDRVVVLRNGRVSGRAPIAGVTKAQLAEMMVGRDVTVPYAHRAPILGAVRLAVDRLGGPGLEPPLVRRARRRDPGDRGRRRQRTDRAGGDARRASPFPRRLDCAQRTRHYRRSGRRADARGHGLHAGGPVLDRARPEPLDRREFDAARQPPSSLRARPHARARTAFSARRAS